MYSALLLCGAVMLISMFYAFFSSVETARNTRKWRETASARRSAAARRPTSRGDARHDHARHDDLASIDRR
jgi:hypothetical protein